MGTNKTTGKPAKVKTNNEQLETIKEKQADETGQQSEELQESVKTATSEQQKSGVNGTRKQSAGWLAPYCKAYPGEKAFHVTSDRQVFLEKDKGLAVLHQNSLGNGELVQTIKVK